MLTTITAHDIFTGACAIGALVAFVGVWWWVGRVLDDIPSAFHDDTNDYWGL